MKRINFTGIRRDKPMDHVVFQVKKLPFKKQKDANTIVWNLKEFVDSVKNEKLQQPKE